ncbi:MAG: hypothetical protein AAFP18_11620 [Bacteroidota bacterium]
MSRLAAIIGRHAYEELREEDPNGDGIFRIWVETPAGYTCQTSCTDVRVTVAAGLLYNPITGEQGTTLLVGWDTITGVGIQYYPTPDAPDPPNEGTVVATATPETPIQNDDGEPTEGDSEEILGFLGQDVTTADGYHAYLEAAMGNSILSRIGAIAKQDLRWGPSGKLREWLSDDPVPERDNYEMAFAAASILAQFVEGMVDDEGSIIDEVIIAKTSRVPWVGSAILALREKVDAGALSDYLARYAAIAMFVESGPFQDQLGDQFLGEVQSELIDCFTKAIVERECFDDMHAFAISLSDRPAFIRFAERVFTSPDAYGWGRDVYEQYGDDFSDAAQLLVEDEERGGISERAGYRWLGVLANSPPLKDDLTASGDAGYYLLRLGEALDDSRLHWKSVEDVLAINDFDVPGPPEAYTRAEFVEDMADLAGALRTDAARNNFRELVGEVEKEGRNSNQPRGYLYELTASARLVRDSQSSLPDANPSADYNNVRYTDANGSTELLDGDLDLYLDGEFYEMKRSTTRNKFKERQILKLAKLAEVSNVARLNLVGPQDPPSNGTTTVMQVVRQSTNVEIEYRSIPLNGRD